MKLGIRHDRSYGAEAGACATIHRAAGDFVIGAPHAGAQIPYVRGLRVYRNDTTKAWLPAGFLTDGGHMPFDLSNAPLREWGGAPDDVPPPFLPAATAHSRDAGL